VFSLNDLRRWVRRYPAYLLGRTPRLHRIPWGPLRGWRVFMSWDISPRMWLGMDEPWIVRLVTTLVAPGAVVYDLGAHIGYTTLLMAKQVGRAGKVHAFEILPSLAEGFLRRSVEGNGLSQVSIHVSGLADAPAELDLAAGPTLMVSLGSRRAQTGRLERCAVRPLDVLRQDLSLPAPALIKMDIEGAEVAALAGAVETLKATRPLLIVEFHSVDLLRRGLAFLARLGYRFETARGPLTQADADALTTFHESVLCRPSGSA
jgi:FkbM family methyltransferase